MPCFFKARRVCLAIALALNALGTAHATFPGENGVIVYADGQGLWKIQGDGTGTPTAIPGGGLNPMVSPNGRKLAFIATNGAGVFALKVMNLDGSNPQVIDQVEGAQTYAAWSPDGKTLARIDAAGTVYLHDLNTRGKKTLASVGPWSHRLSWSPLGDKIAVGTTDKGGWWIDVASGQVAPLPYLANPDWFPDNSGSLVGMDSRPNTLPCLNRMNPDGSNRVVFPVCAQSYASVSPDGTRVLAASRPSFGAYTLTVQTFEGNLLEDIALQANDHADWSRVPKTAMRTTLANNGWSAAVPLGNDADTYTSQSAIAVMPDQGAQGGALRRAVAIGPDGRVIERAQGVNGTWGTWFTVPGLSGNVAAGVVARQVAIAGALDGSSQVVIVGSDGLIYHAMRYPNGLWSGFNPVDGANGAPNFAARDVAIAIVNSGPGTPGEAHVVANGLGGGAVYHRVRLADGNWTPWGAPGGPATESLALAFAGNKDLYLVATTPASGIVRQVRRANGSWDGWVTVSSVFPNGLKDVSLSVASDPSTRQPVTAYLAYVDELGRVVSQTRHAPTLALSWTNAPSATAAVMANGRSVAMAISAGVPELVVVQTQPQ